MKLLVALLGVWLAAGAPAVAAGAPQPLSISVHGQGAQATLLPEYEPGAPIAVTVTNRGAQHLDALTVVASGPAGESIRMPLSRAADGTYTGSLALSDEGAWRLRLTSRAGSLSTDTTPISLAVQAPPPSNAWLTGVAVGAAVFLIVGGSGFFILRRTVGARSATGRGLAA